VDSPALQSLAFSKYLLLNTFVLDHSLVVVLTQKDQQGNECPISFMSMVLQGVELNYPLMYKKFFVIHKAIKHIRP
jgi:hypothetical protein